MAPGRRSSHKRRSILKFNNRRFEFYKETQEFGPITKSPKSSSKNESALMTSPKAPEKPKEETKSLKSDSNNLKMISSKRGMSENENSTTIEQTTSVVKTENIQKLIDTKMKKASRGEESRLDLKSLAKELPPEHDSESVVDEMMDKTLSMTSSENSTDSTIIADGSNDALNSPGILSENILPGCPRAVSVMGSPGGVPDPMQNISFTSESSDTNDSADYTESTIASTDHTDKADYQPAVEVTRFQGLVEVTSRRVGSQVQLDLCLGIKLRDIADREGRKESGADGCTKKKLIRVDDGSGPNKKKKKTMKKKWYPSQNGGFCKHCDQHYSRQWYLRKHQKTCEGSPTLQKLWRAEAEKLRKAADQSAPTPSTSLQPPASSIPSTPSNPSTPSQASQSNESE